MQPKKRKLLGVLFIVLPPAALILILIAWSVVSFVMGQMIYSGSVDSGQGLATTANIINVALGFLGILSVLMIPIGLVVGIVLLVTNKKNAPQSTTVPQDSKVPDNQ